MPDILKHSGTNIGGINKILYAFIEDIDNIAYNEATLIATITLKSGKLWNYLYGTEDTITFSGDEEETDAGTLYKYTADMMIPKDRSEVEIILQDLNDHGIIMKIMNKNGTCRVFGKEDHPIYKSGKLLWPGQVEGYNGYKLTFYKEFTEPAYFLQGESSSDFIDNFPPDS